MPHRPISARLVLVACVSSWMVFHGTVSALDWVTLEVDGQLRQVGGRLLVEAQDGGLLLESTDGRIWTALPDQIRSRSADDAEFRYQTRAELTEGLLTELPQRFRVHHTAHYLICYDTSPAYAQWCGALSKSCIARFSLSGDARDSI